MSSQDKKMLDREAVRSVIQQWNANRLDLFALSEPDENLLFHGVMRFYFQDEGQKVATKCIRVASDATVSDVIETLIEKFRPDMRMLSVPNYALYEVHANGEERRLNPDEKPLLVQLNWHIDDREGRFLLRNVDQKSHTIESTDNNFKRKLSKREKKEQKKKEKLAKLNSDAAGDGENHVAEKLYTELPETSFTRSISNPEAVMRRRRQQKLEKKLQQFRSKDGGPDTGGTLKIYGESLCRDVPYKTLLLSIRDCAQAVVREMLAKYGLDKADPLHYCLVQVNSDGTEYILDDDECPLSILMNHPTSRGSIMFHVRRRPADSQPRRRKKKPLGVSNGTNNISSEREGPMLVEVTHSGDGGRRLKLGSDPIEVGSANTNTLQLFGPSIQPRHCLISLLDGVCTVTPLHPDALTFVNGHHITQPTILHNGSVVMFGRVASYRFVDSPSDGRYNLALSQSQLDSACLYESRSPTSPTSWNDDERALSPNLKTDFEKLHGHDQGIASMHDDKNSRHAPPPGSNGGAAGTHGGVITHNDAGRPKETDFNYDPENAVETETKSISSIRSGGSNQDATRNIKSIHASGPDMQVGQEPILPAVLEFPETHQESFLRQVITDLDVNAPNFKLAPVYTLYLCARYRASTHYRPELQPTERAHKLTIFLHHVANLIYSVIQEQYTDPRILAFWMANSSEFLHFLKSDRHISAFSVQAQEVLAECVQTAFRNLVNCFRVELSQTLNQFLSENIDHDSAAGLVLTVLGSAMALLRRCRVNAALTIQLFSQLFHYINVICFNTIVSNSHMCTAEWGRVMSERLQLLELWAERQGLELAADCHLAKMNQCAQFLQAPKTTVEEIQQLACSCFRLNSLQMAALLQQEQIPRNLVDTVIRMAESVADELTRADGREVRLEESPELHLALLLPDDGFSCDVVRGIPSGLVDFLNPLQAAGMCRLAAQPSSVGLWTVYMHQFNTRSPSAMSNKLPQPEVQVIKLHKNSNGMGLSIVAAKGAGQERLGIYIKSVVPGGAADADGRLQAGDQLLRVDGQSLIGITQERDAKAFTNRPPWFTEDMQILLEEKNKTWRRYKRHNTSHNFMLYKKANSLLKARVRDAKNRYALLVQCRAADYLVRTGPVVTLEVAKQGAIYHGLATLLQQPSPIIQRGNRRMSERDISRMGTDGQKAPLGSTGGPGQHLPNSKSVPALHHVGNIGMSGSKSRSIHSLVNNNEQGFYQNLSVYRAQNQSQPVLNERPQMASQTTINSIGGTATTTSINQSVLSRPTSAYYSSNNTVNTMPSANSISYLLSPGSNTISNNSASNGNISAAGPPPLASHQHHQHLQQQQQQQQQSHVPPPQGMMGLGGRSKNPNTFARDIQNQHSLRLNQMMAPSMPNIAHSSGYASNISASQSMQNVNMIPGQGPPDGLSNQYPNTPPNMHMLTGHHPDFAGQQRIQNPGNAQMRAQAKLAEMGELVNRRNQRHEMGMHALDGQLISPTGSTGTIPKPGMPPMHNPNMQRMSPVKQLPPTAPKPQGNRSQGPPYMQKPHGHEESTPPLPPTTTHPLFKTPNTNSDINYVASTLDPPKAAYYPVTATTASSHQAKNFIGTNPWEREEREKENEIRREHIRHWRDQQISELSAIQHRTPQQEEQLKTLVLERDFERRALEVEDPEDDSETNYSKDNVQEVIRLANQANTIQTPVTNFRQVDVKVTPTAVPPPEDTPTTMADPHQSYQSYPIQQSQIVPTPTVQPKSILKHNRYDGSSTTMPSSPSKSQKSASFADDHKLQTEHQISQITKEIAGVDLNSETINPPLVSRDIVDPLVPPPPPPERGSSYLVMSQQQQKMRNSNPQVLKSEPPNPAPTYIPTGHKRTTLGNGTGGNNNNNNNSGNANNNNSVGGLPGGNPANPGNLPNSSSHIITSSSSSSSSSCQITNTNSIGMNRDNKRVSFHDEENNMIPSPEFTPEQADLEVIREDPNRFIQETTAILQTPTTPEADVWNNTIQSTPGVIGAQEVYRDPRQKRLQEQQKKQQQQSSDAVPEKLSFKEKMKMFALESGENQTPKDKLKISRAQRDIDAVH